jgi:hypothetical protein
MRHFTQGKSGLRNKFFGRRSGFLVPIAFFRKCEQLADWRITANYIFTL